MPLGAVVGVLEKIKNISSSRGGDVATALRPHYHRCYQPSPIRLVTMATLFHPAVFPVRLAVQLMFPDVC
jgi:hypothetical protein